MPKENRRPCLLISAIPVVLMVLTASLAVPYSNAATENTVTVDVGTTYQTLEGFGAATAWYTNWLTNHPNKAAIYTRIFGDLGLDIIRFRNTYGNRNGASFAPDEAAIVAAANESLGHTIKVMISSWTPPSDLKVNAVLNGGTLAKESGAFVYDKFAQYWHDSLGAYANIGIVPDYISIQNEPEYENTGWETCIFKPTETSSYPGYDQALDKVYSKIKTLSNCPKILGPEVSGINGDLAAYTKAMDLTKVYGIAHHLYNGGDAGTPDSFVDNMQNYAGLYSGKPIFQTEYDYGTAFNTSLLIYNSLVKEGVGAYFYWSLIWASGNPLVVVENPSDKSSWTTTNGYSVTDYYYTFKHFSKFTAPGDKRVAATSNNSDIRSTAFISEDGTQLSVILINTGNSEASATLGLKGFTKGKATIYRTTSGSTTEKCTNIGNLGADNAVTLPAKSIATVVVTSDSTTPTASPIVTPTASATATPAPTPTTTATANPTPTPTPSSAAYAVNYSVQSDWGSGATVNVVIKNNTSTAFKGWALTWKFNGNQKIINLWNGSYTQSATAVTVSNASHNGTIPAKGSVNFGFNLSYSGTNPLPTVFTLTTTP